MGRVLLHLAIVAITRVTTCLNVRVCQLAERVKPGSIARTIFVEVPKLWKSPEVPTTTILPFFTLCKSMEARALAALLTGVQGSKRVKREPIRPNSVSAKRFWRALGSMASCYGCSCMWCEFRHMRTCPSSFRACTFDDYARRYLKQAQQMDENGTQNIQIGGTSSSSIYTRRVRNSYCAMSA